MWLYTGLFITAHDAMHGVLCRRWPTLNHGLGHICTLLYALMWYPALKKAHHRHHAYAGTDRDPDFDAPGDGSMWKWFYSFFKNYMTLRQFSMLIVTSWVFLALGIPLMNLFVFWLLPSVASTFQLFFVGTWLPHRSGRDLSAPHRARSLNVSEFWSLLACFHFGYHLEHHQHPDVPWWRLPTVRRTRVDATG